ncbi:golgin subfamily A member 6-like protein 26 [Montipora foliosa]|uniref:golgin subfamily A member 6-like protein 26 n=1 Tax=Montipora foliosa TaxID=591990 RepID=UPI0035F202F8
MTPSCSEEEEITPSRLQVIATEREIFEVKEDNYKENDTVIVLPRKRMASWDPFGGVDPFAQPANTSSNDPFGSDDPFGLNSFPSQFQQTAAVYNPQPQVPFQEEDDWKIDLPGGGFIQKPGSQQVPAINDDFDCPEQRRMLMEKLDKLLASRAAKEQTLRNLVTNENYLRRSLMDVNEALDDQNAELSKLTESIHESKTLFLAREEEKKRRLVDKRELLQIVEKEEKKIYSYQIIANESRELKKRIAQDLEKKKELEKMVTDQRAIRRVSKSKVRTLQREEQAFWMQISQKVKWMAENGYALQEPNIKDLIAQKMKELMPEEDESQDEGEAESSLQDAAQPNVEDQPDDQEKASQKSAERLPDDIKTNEEEKKDEELQAGREDHHRDIEEDEAICEETAQNRENTRKFEVEEDVTEAGEKTGDQPSDAKTGKEARDEELCEKTDDPVAKEKQNQKEEESSDKKETSSNILPKVEVTAQPSEASPVKAKSQKKENKKRKRNELKEKKEEAKRENKAKKEKEKLEKKERKKNKKDTEKAKKEDKNNVLLSGLQTRDSLQLDPPGGSWVVDVYSVKSTKSIESEAIPATTVTVKADVHHPTNNNKPDCVRTFLRPNKKEIKAQLAKNREQQELAEMINQTEYKETEESATKEDEEEERESNVDIEAENNEDLQDSVVHDFQWAMDDEKCTEKSGCFSFLNNVFGRFKFGSRKKSTQKKSKEMRRRAMVSWNDAYACQVPAELVTGKFMLAHQGRVMLHGNEQLLI